MFVKPLFFALKGIPSINKENARIKQVLKENIVRKALLVKSLRELLIITACLSYSNKRKPQISKRKRSK